MGNWVLILRWGSPRLKKEEECWGGLCLGCAEDPEDSAGPAENLLFSGLEPWNWHSMGESRWLEGSRLIVSRWRLFRGCCRSWRPSSRVLPVGRGLGTRR